MKIRSKTLRTRIKTIINRFLGLKLISESAEVFLFKCRDCDSSLEVRKGYGKVKILCKCGFSANTWTGPDTHFRQVDSPGKPWEWNPGAREKEALAKQQKDAIEKRHAVFQAHLRQDLRTLYDHVSDRRDIRRKATRTSIQSAEQGRKACELVVAHLKEFLDLDAAQIRVIWEPLQKGSKALCDGRHNIQVLGTTYYLSLGGKPLYSIYLNPSLIGNSDAMPATVAHELSHVYTAHNRLLIASPDSSRGNHEYIEHMTDLLGIVLGMGPLMATSSAEDEAHNIGYLTGKMIHEAVEVWENDFLSGRDVSIKQLLPCPRCSQKLKIPLRRSGLRVICPKCKNELAH